MNKRKLAIIVAAIVAMGAMPAKAATERMPCTSTEARATPAGAYLWVTCPGEGRLMPEGMEVHFADKRDYVVRSLKLVALDGPLGGTAGPAPADPRIASALREARALIDDALARLPK